MNKTRVLLLIITFAVLITVGLFFILTTPRENNKKTQKKAVVSPTPIASTLLSFAPSDDTFDGSGNITLNVEIDTGYNQVTGVQLELGYDPEVINILDIEPGPFLPSAVELLNNQEIAGRHSYMIGLPPSQNPVNGKGIVAKIVLQRNPAPTQKNQTTLSIMPKSLVTSLGIEGSVLKQADSITLQLPTVTQFPGNTEGVSPTQP